MSSKLIKNILAAACASSAMFLFASCSDRQENDSFAWGRSTEYGNFLWNKYVPDTLTREIVLDFNDDAEQYMVSPVSFGLFEKNDFGEMVPVDNDKVEVYVNGSRSEDNLIEIMPPAESVKVGLVLTDKVAPGSVNWYLRPVDDGGLDRINDMTREEFSGAGSALMEIQLRKRHIWNPLASGLTAALCVIAAVLLLWILCLKYAFYPVFRVKSITMTEPDPYFSSHTVKGARKFVLTPRKQSQSMLSRLFTGRIIYETNPLWTTVIEIIPRDRRSVRIGSIGTDWFVLTKVLKIREEYILENRNTKGRTIIKIS